MRDLALLGDRLFSEKNIYYEQIEPYPVLPGTGLGTGKLREHFEAIVKKGGKFYLSGMSCKARGVGINDLKNKPAELAMPDVLVRLSVESDRMFVY